jgi:hypothetical protein
MNNTPATQQQPRGYPLPFAIREQRYVRKLWRRRKAISIWLLEHTIIFLAAKRVAWACGSDEDIEDYLIFFGSLARTYFRLPRGPYPAGEPAYTVLTDLVQTAICMLVFWFAWNFYFDNKS